MIKKDEKGNVQSLKTARFLLEVIESPNGRQFVLRSENGVPIISAFDIDAFVDDFRQLVVTFDNTTGNHE